MSFRTRVLPSSLLVVLALVGGACSDKELTPEEARRQRVQDRLEASFTDEQAACMLERFSEGVLIALDGEGKMPQGEPELSEFTTTARECITGEGREAPAEGSTTVPEGDDPAEDQTGGTADDGGDGSATGGSDEPAATSDPQDAGDGEGTEPSDADPTSDGADDGGGASGSDE